MFQIMAWSHWLSRFAVNIIHYSNWFLIWDCWYQLTYRPWNKTAFRCRFCCKTTKRASRPLLMTVEDFRFQPKFSHLFSWSWNRFDLGETVWNRQANDIIKIYSIMCDAIHLVVLLQSHFIELSIASASTQLRICFPFWDKNFDENEEWRRKMRCYLELLSMFLIHTAYPWFGLINCKVSDT